MSFSSTNQQQNNRRLVNRLNNNMNNTNMNNNNNNNNNENIDTQSEPINLPTTSSASNTNSNLTNRPMTRSFFKQQQQHQQQQQQNLNTSLISLSSLSSSNSSLNSMDTTNTINNLNQENKFNPFLTPETNSFLSQLTQDKYNFETFKNYNELALLEEEKSYQKILCNEKSINIINFIDNSRLYANGRINCTITNLSNSMLQFFTQRLKSHDYPLLIKRLDQSSITLNLKQGSQEVDDLIQILREIENRLVNYNSNANDLENNNEDDNQMREEFEVETINLESAMMFRQYGGVDIFKRILLLSILIMDKSNLDDFNLNKNDETCKNSNPTTTTTTTNSTTTINTTKTNISNLINQNSLSTNILNKNVNNQEFLLNENNKFFTNNLNNNNNYNLINNNNNTNTMTNLNNNNNNNQKMNKNLVNLNHNINTKKNNSGFEKSFILKIKCKVIYILNRLICLPHFGKLLVYDLLNYKPVQTNQQQQQQQQSSNNKISFNNQNNNNNNNLDYDTTLLQYLFSLIMFKESRLQACQLIESILLHIPMLNLNRIQNLRFILETLDDDGLSCICKIFAVTLSNLDLVDKKYLTANRRSLNQAQQQQQQQQQTNLSSQNSTQSQPNLNKPTDSSNLNQSSSQTQSLSIRDQNQEFLLSIPCLLFRLVNLVRRKDYTIRFTGANNEIEHWIRYIDEALSDSDDNESMDTTSNSNLNSLDSQLNQPALIAAAKLNNFVYVLYTLSLLLIGKEKKKVQKQLTKLRLANALNSLFDHLIWNCRCEYPNQDNQQQQMRSHICPEVAVKIQFLRLVHSFCDHSDYKRVILSKEETDEIYKYNQEANVCLQINEQLLKIESRLRCTKDSVGLLSKIVQVIKKEPFSASFRFWLIRAIESYLRGGTSYAEQLFLINRGIVEDTVQNILAVNFTRPKEVIQSCFDMLGELIKFNTKGFEILNSQLLDTEKFNLLLTMVNQSLIDSNMFLRSIFLSIDFIEQNSNALDYKISSNKVLTYFDLFERRITFLSRMMNIININNLSQENISCLNTTLIVLMLANRRNILPKYLRAIKSKSIEMLLTSDYLNLNNNSRTETSLSSTSNQRSLSNMSTSASTSSHPVDLISNFKDLLQFWQTHYLQKDKDCAGLEQNSKIEFSYWKKTVDLLLDTNHKNECSLNFYLHNDYMNMNSNRKNSIDDYRSE